ncbi:MAG: chromosomal replication initiator protein DnaA [Calditrichia bacterium]
MSKQYSSPGKPTPVSEKSLQEKWNDCLSLIEKDVNSQSFQTWFMPIRPVTFVDQKLILRVPSQFFFEWLDSNFKSVLKNSVNKIFGLRAQVEYLIASTPDHQPEELNLVSSEKSERKDSEHSEPSEGDFVQFDSRFQFDNFFVKNDNELALRVAQEVAKQPGKTDFTPLFIFGDQGCGKSHLLNALGYHIASQQKRKHIKFMCSETFLNEYIYALQHRKIDVFKKNFKKVDVLLLDDIQFLSNKKRSQEGLYFILSDLERRRKQIVITSSQAPAQLVGFEERLVAFFQKGLIIDLIPPSYETRLRWIDDYCQKNSLEILPDVREFLSRTFDNGLHQMRAIMVRIAAQTSLLGKPVSLAKIKKILSNVDAQWARKNGKFPALQRIKIEKVIQTVSEYTGVPYDILVGFSRQREVTFARQIAIYLCKELTGEPLKVIGYHFGDRHYTGIIHNYRKICEELKSNSMLNKTIIELRNKFN